MRKPEPPSGPTRRDVFGLLEELDCWSCAYCDAPFGGSVEAEMDHVNPLAKGGVHDWSNIAPACRDCNRLKSDQDIADWLGLLAGPSSAECNSPDMQSG
ncbi:HNH endonuclease [Streptomyces sp. H27-H1]|uniref:HNH endonuclease n=1 Tax=Streptomyces sp. H27-H1 TaxID=2996461 RepID=UPI003B639B02